MAKDLISNTKTWFTLTPAQQKAVIKLDFEEKYKNGNNAIYNKAGASTRARLEQAHTQIVEEGAYNSEHNPSIKRQKEKQEEADNGNWLSNTFTKIVDSHTDAARRLAIIPDAMNPDGIVSNKFAEQASNIFAKRRERIVTAEEKDVANVLLTAEKKIKAAGGMGTWGGIKAALETIPDLVTNPVGVLHLAADSSSSMTTIAAGAGAGSVAGPVGAAAGMFTAETADAANSKFLELAEAKLASQNLPPTRANLEYLAQDKEFIKDAQIKSDKYATALAATDMAMGAGVSRLFTSPARVALKTAREVVKAGDQVALTTAAKAAGIAVEKFTENAVNQKAAAILKARSFKAKLGQGAGMYAGELIGEPVSEAAAKTAIKEDITFTDLMNETLGGVGTGPIGAAVNTATFGTKVTADTLTDKVKGAVQSTPETKAAMVEVKDTLKQTQRFTETPADHNYKKDIAATDHEAEDSQNYFDPTHADYNPRKAMDIVANSSDPDAHTKANQITNDYMDKVEQTYAQLTEWDKKAKTDGLTVPETKIVDKLKDLYMSQLKFADQLYNTSDQIIAKVKDKTKPITDVTVDLKTAPADEIVEKLGSRGTSLINPISTEEFNTAISRKDLDAETKSMLTLQRDAQIKRAEIEQANKSKTIEEVGHDIYHGERGSFFKGIDAYKAGINYFLSPKSATDSAPLNPIKAAKELEGLKKFSAAHTEKAAIVSGLWETVKAGKEFSPEQQTIIADMTRKNPNFKMDTNSIKYVTNIKREAVALKKEVMLAEMTYNLLLNKSNSTVSSTAQSASTSQISKPAAPIVAPTSIDANAARSITKLQEFVSENNIDKIQAGIGSITHRINVHGDKDGTLQAAVDTATTHLKKQGLELVDTNPIDSYWDEGHNVSAKFTGVEGTIPGGNRVVRVNAPALFKNGIQVKPASIEVETDGRNLTMDQVKEERQQKKVLYDANGNAPATVVEPAPASTPNETNEPQAQIEAPSETPVDILADYGKDYASLPITFKDAEGNEQTMTYNEAMDLNNLKKSEAEAVLECTKR